MNDNTQLAEMVAAALAQRLQQEKVAAEITLTDIERTTRQLMQEISREAVEIAVKQTQKKYPPAVSACECGDEARYVRRRSARLHTIFGKATVERAYYLCATCQTGHYPLDRQLGLRPNRLSAELERLAALTGVQLPFEKGSQLLQELTLVSLSDQALAKACRNIGQKVVQREAQLRQTAQDSAFLAQQEREHKRPRRLYGAMDAAKVHIRADEQSNWRDLKLGAWFEARGKPPASPDGEWRIQAENISYYADICPSTEFSSLMWATGVAHDANLAEELILLGDGADWIWNLAAENFPKAIQILDWFHACEHLMPVAQAAFSDAAQCSAWVQQMRQYMWDGDTDKLIAACRSLAQTNPHDTIRRAVNYFETHKQRMRYAHFRKQGFQIGSGSIESAAKQIGLMRMKVPGAIWDETNAVLVAKARAEYLSNRWQDLPLAC